MYFKPGTVTILRCSTCCQLCLPQTWGPGSFDGDCSGCGEYPPYGQKCAGRQATGLQFGLCPVHTHSWASRAGTVAVGNVGEGNKAGLCQRILDVPTPGEPAGRSGSP